MHFFCNSTTKAAGAAAVWDTSYKSLETAGRKRWACSKDALLPSNEAGVLASAKKNSGSASAFCVCLVLFTLKLSAQAQQAGKLISFTKTRNGGGLALT